MWKYNVTDYRGASVIVVNVEYRLAPEHKIPASLDDGVCATRWVMDNKFIVGKCRMNEGRKVGRNE